MLVTLALAAWAGEAPADPAAAWRWGGDPWATAPALALAAALWVGVRRARPSPARRLGLFAGWLALAAALASPLEALADALLSAHMAQHLLLVQVAAPLLAASRPEGPLLLALPGRARLVAAWRAGGGWRRGVEALASPAGAFLAHLAALWAWHAPPAYDAALADERLHALEHACLFGTAVLFWRVALQPRPRASVGPLGGLLLVFATALHSGALAVLIGFAPAPWYASYARTTRAFGLTPLGDQQLGGALMWVVGGVGYAIAGLALLGVALETAGRRAWRRPVVERGGSP